MIIVGTLLLLPTLYLVALAWRRAADDIDAADIERIEQGFASWTDHTPVIPLRAVAWPERQSPTDLAPVYEPVWSPPNWARSQLNDIIWAARRYEELVAAA